MPSACFSSLKLRLLMSVSSVVMVALITGLAVRKLSPVLPLKVSPAKEITIGELLSIVPSLAAA